MWWQYLLVFIGSLLFDVVPFPFPPAFTIMIFFQIVFGLNIWWVIIVGVSGSVLGRYLLTQYIPFLSVRIFKKAKNEDVQFLGQKLKEQGWKAQLAILAYTLLPLPTTPLFLASGIARVKGTYVIPMFLLGKFTSDTVTVYLGRYVSQNAESMVASGLSWKSVAGLLLGAFFLSSVLFVEWRMLIQKKKFVLNFRIWKTWKGSGLTEADKAGSLAVNADQFKGK